MTTPGPNRPRRPKPRTWLGHAMLRAAAACGGFLQRWRRRGGTGPRGERVAERFLRGLGYRVLARNLQLGMGEIDLLAESPDGAFVVVVEVKSRALGEGADAGGPLPEEHVNQAKQRKLAGLGQLAVRRLGLQDRRVRFDVVAVDLPARGKPVVRHHVAAFESWY